MKTQHFNMVLRNEKKFVKRKSMPEEVIQRKLKTQYLVIIRRGATVFPFVIPVSVVVPIIARNSMVLFGAFVGSGKGRGPSTVAIAFTVMFTVTVNTVAVVPITVAVAVTVSIIAPPIGPIGRGGSASSPVRGPGAGPPAVTVAITVTVPVVVPVAIVLSAGAAGAFTITARRGASFVAPNGRGRILGPLDAQPAAFKVPSMHVVVGVFGIAAIAELDKSVTTREVEGSKCLSVLFSTECIIDRREGRSESIFYRARRTTNCIFSLFTFSRELALNTNKWAFVFSHLPQRV